MAFPETTFKWLNKLRIEAGKATIIYPIAFLVAVASTIYALGMVFYLQERFAATGKTVGIFSAVWLLSYLICCLILQPIYNKILPRYLILLSTISSCAILAGIAITKSLWLVLFFQILLGASTALFWPPLAGWLSHGFEGRELSKIQGKYNLCWSSGIIAGPYLAGWLSKQETILPIYVTAFLFFVASCLMVGANLTLPALSSSRKTSVNEDIRTPDAQKVETPLRYPAWVGIFVSFLFFGIINTIYPYYAREAYLNFSKTTIGLLLLIKALFNTLAFIILGYLSFWHFRAWQMIVSMLILALLALGMKIFPEAVPTGFFLAGVGMMLAATYANSLFHGTSGSKNRTSRAAINEALLALGQACGAFFGGIIYDIYSMAGVYNFLIFCLLFGAIVQIFLVRILQKSPQR